MDWLVGVIVEKESVEIIRPQNLQEFRSPKSSKFQPAKLAVLCP